MSLLTLLATSLTHRRSGIVDDRIAHMLTSMRLAKHEDERDNEELIALVVADMQDPVTPILEAALVGEGLHEAGRMIARLSEIVHHGAEVIEEYLLRVGAVEIYLGHVQSPSNRASLSALAAARANALAASTCEACFACRSYASARAFS
jgi:hypothetical protein